MANNSPLNQTRYQKNDEFYTREQDIEQEIPHYAASFRGASVLLNCDDPAKSCFWSYFHTNFSRLGLKRLTASRYSPDGGGVSVYDGGSDPDISVYDDSRLSSDGDFRSPEILSLMDEADVVVTNPPFSLLRQFLSLLIRREKRFLVIANQPVLAYNELFPLIRDGRVRVGISAPRRFTRPDGSVERPGNTLWLTNLEADTEKPPIPLTQLYDPEKYPAYDNYDAIEVSKTKDIPADYEGVMGVPVSFIMRFTPSQFTILGVAATEKYREEIQGIPLKPSCGVRNGKTVLNGRETFNRVFIKRKGV